jgi:hypothetical protein
MSAPEKPGEMEKPGSELTWLPIHFFNSLDLIGNSLQ